MNKLIFSCLLLLVGSAACKKKNIPKVEYANEMRKMVIELSIAAKSIDPDFLIIPQNGSPLATVSRKKDGALALDYLAAIDGQGQEGLFYGYEKDDKATPAANNTDLTYYLSLMEENGIQVLTTDYCSTLDKINDSFDKNETLEYVSYAATERNLTNIPDYNVNVHNENTEEIENLSQVKNFLYLINPTEKFSNKVTFMNELKATNYDLILIDRDFNDENYTVEDIESLKWKANGAKRLVICYMSIGEAEDYRSYWNKEWEKNKTSPAWLYKENRKWRGNYKVFYWTQEWKDLIYGTESSYLTSLLNLGFDGTYLDIIDAYEYYEEI